MDPEDRDTWITQHRPLRVMEMWTWKQEILKQSASEGWLPGKAISIETGFDLRSQTGQQEAREEVAKFQPDLLVMAFPCSPWSQLQNLQRDKGVVAAKRRRDRTFLAFAREMADYQNSRGKGFLIENPVASKAWNEKPMQTHYRFVACDMCRFGLKDPWTKRPLKKRTDLMTNLRGLADFMATQKCACSPETEHTHIVGSTWLQEARGNT